MKGSKRLPAIAPDAVMTGVPYGRVSSDEQAKQGLSVPHQEQACIDYIARQGWLAGEWRADVERGSKVERSAYQATLAHVRDLRQAGRPVAVVVSRLDRLGRRLSEFARAREELNAMGVRIHSVGEGGALSDVMAGILATLAEEEVRVLGERVASVFEHARSAGWWKPGRQPWGYRARPATAAERGAGAPHSVLDISDAEAAAVREAFERVNAGASLRAVARWAAGLPRLARGGRVFSLQAMQRVLRSRTYIGQQPDGRPGNWPAVVNLRTWDATQATLDAIPEQPAHQATGRYLLTGLLYCPRCGGRMTGFAAGRGRPARYRCNAQHSGHRLAQRPCNFSVNAHRLDADVRAQVEPLVVNAPRLLAAAMRAAAPDELLGADPDRADAISKAVAFGERARRRLRDLTLLLADGTLTREAYKDAAEVCRAEAAWADQEQARLREQHAPAPAVDLDQIIHDADRWRENWHADALPEQRAVLAELVTRIQADTGPAYRRQVTGRISWSLTGQYLRTLMGIMDPPTNGAVEAPHAPEQPID